MSKLFRAMTLRDRAKRLQAADLKEATRLLFEWVKTGKLNVSEFKHLMQLIAEKENEVADNL